MERDSRVVLAVVSLAALASSGGAQAPVRDLDAVMARVLDPEGLDPSTRPPAPVLFAGRTRRDELTRRGQKRTAAAIGLGLEWLARHQAPDGRWSARTFMALDDGGEPGDGAGEAGRDVGATGIALLAFLGDGHTTEAGDHRELVRRGVAWLCAVQDEQSGAFGDAGTMPREALDHAIATWALVEAAGSAPYPSLQVRARLALIHLMRLRTPDGTWQTAMPDGSVDVAVTSTWACMACVLAGQLGVVPVVDGLDSAVEAIREDPGSAALDVLLRYFRREVRARADVPDDLVDRADRATVAAATGPSDTMRTCFGVLAIYQVGGNAWFQTDNRLMGRGRFYAHRDDGRFAGSWDPSDAWTDGTGGRVFSTALGVLTLEVYYRFTRLTRH